MLAYAKELAQLYGEEGQHILTALRTTYACVNKFNRKRTEGDIKNPYQDMKHELLRHLYKSHHCWKFVENPPKLREDLFAFVKDPHIDSTYSRAGRAEYYNS